MLERANRKATLLINVILGQSLIVILIGLWGYLGANFRSKIRMHFVTSLSLFFGVAFAFLAMFLLKEILRLYRNEAESELNSMRIKESNELLDVLRTTRHDFLNHIQVVYSLAQMGKVGRLKEYIGELTEGMEIETRLSQLAQPEIAALLIKKSSVAANMGIKFDILLETELKGLHINPTDFVRVIGNLVENAFYAVKDLDCGDKKVMLKLTEDSAYFMILVCNSGPVIPESIAGRIFDKGFTTKGEEGNGLGLYITTRILEKYGGTIRVTEAAGLKTCFEVRLPRTG